MHSAIGLLGVQEGFDLGKLVQRVQGLHFGKIEHVVKTKSCRRDLLYDLAEFVRLLNGQQSEGMKVLEAWVTVKLLRVDLGHQLSKESQTEVAQVSISGTAFLFPLCCI